MRVGVYGLGRFGSFWAGVLASAGFEVLGYSRKTKASIPGVSIKSEDEVLNADAVFFCVAISALDDVLERTAPKIGKNTLVFDTCSVKVYPEDCLKKHLSPLGIKFIPSHPMFGPDSAAAKGLKDLPIIMCPGFAPEADFTFWKNEFTRMTLKVIEMSSYRHDREAAFSQGITHFVGRTLQELNLPDTEIGTVGFKSLMTIVEQTCNDPMTLFLDLQRYNPYTEMMRVELRSALDSTMALIGENIDSKSGSKK